MKLIVAHVVKKLLEFYGVRRFVTVFVTTASEPNPESGEYSPRSQIVFFKFYIKLSVQMRLGFTKGLF